jgi:hypothetical protein
MNARSFWALVKFHVATCLTRRSWLFVAPVFFLAFLSFIVDKRHYDEWWNPVAMDASSNLWDVGLGFFENIYNDVFLVLIGFMLLVGDDFIRGHNDGTLRSTLLLSRSHAHWWYAKVVSFGIRALVYMSIIFLAMVAASAVMGIPIFGLHNSDASVRLAELRNVDRWYRMPKGWSTMGYTAFSFLSTAFAIWIIAVVQQVISLFVFPNRKLPFVFFFGWLILGFVVQADAAFWDVRFLLYPGRCFPEIAPAFVSMPVFFGVMTLVLVAATRFGAFKLRKMDF